MLRQEAPSAAKYHYVWERNAGTSPNDTIGAAVSIKDCPPICIIPHQNIIDGMLGRQPSNQIQGAALLLQQRVFRIHLQWP